MKTTLKAFSTWVKRPSLCWMSINEIAAVRQRILGLFLARGEFLDFKVDFPQRSFDVRLGCMNSSPVFIWGRPENTRITWLRVPKAGLPYWHYRDNAKDGDGEVVTLGFNHSKVEIPAQAIKNFLEYFPFKPTENGLQNNGEFIA